LAGKYEFGTTKKFCDHYFGGEVAFKDEPFNSTDNVINNDAPFRRIIDELVISNTGYLWYEHGGRGYHQHLVLYSITKPEDVLENYTFIKSKYGNILSLIKNKNTLKFNKQSEL